MKLNFNDLRDQCHNAALNAGWWKRYATYDQSITIDIDILIRNLNKPWAELSQCLALIHSEISEATIGFIYKKRDKHLPHRTNYEVELADIVIRVMDLLGALKIDVTELIIQCKYKRDYIPIRLDLITEKLAYLHTYVSMALECYRKNIVIDGQHGLIINLGKVIVNVLILAEFSNIDLFHVIQEKLAYNATRADHTIEARYQHNGKKF